LKTWARLAIVAALVAGAAYHASRVALATPRFAVQHIVVKGNHRLSSGEVRALLDGLNGQSMVRTDLGRWKARVLGSPWVGAAELRRLLPDTIEVAIVERVPLCLGRVNGQLFLLDDEGRVIDDYSPQYGDLDLPIVDGLANEGDSIRSARAALAREFLAALTSRADLIARISQIDVTDARDAVVLLDGDPARLHLGDRDFVSRMQSYLELSPALHTKVPSIDYVDLRFEQRVFVRPGVERTTATVSRWSVEQPAFR
jgi:cell division protein FtsQ